MKPLDPADFIYPDWPAPQNVKSVSTTRLGGASVSPFNSNNLALHVADKPETVISNRARLKVLCALPSEPNWLTQTHSNRVVNCTDGECHADGSYSDQLHQVCAVMTADCLPVLLCDKAGQQIAAIHVGWRGLLNNIVENSVELFRGSNSDVIAWLGPAIGKHVFEVGVEIYDAFVGHHEKFAAFFESLLKDKYLMDIYGLARLRLNMLGVTAIYGGEYCTVSDETRFFSYRRDGVCGRMASLIWLDNE